MECPCGALYLVALIGVVTSTSPFRFRGGSARDATRSRAGERFRQRPQQGQIILSAVHFAAATGDTGALRAQIQSAPELVNSPDETGSTPLHYSAANGHRDATEYLLTAGADVNARNATGATAADLARVNGHYEVADILASRSAPPPWSTLGAPPSQPLSGYTQPGPGAAGIWPPPPTSQIGPVGQDVFGDAAYFLPSMSGRMVTINWIGESLSIFQRDAGTWIGTFLLCISCLITAWLIPRLLIILPIALASSSSSSPSGLPSSTPLATPLLIILVVVGSLLSIAVIFVQAYLLCGLQRMANAAVRGEPLTFNILFSGKASTLGYLATIILVGLLSCVGAIACCIGLVVVAAMLGPALALAADGQPSFQSIGRTYSGMRSQWPMAFVIRILLDLLAYVAMIPCGLGLLVLGPMYVIIPSLAYRDVIGMPRRTPTTAT